MNDDLKQLNYKFSVAYYRFLGMFYRRIAAIHGCEGNNLSDYNNEDDIFRILNIPMVYLVFKRTYTVFAVGC